MSRHVHDVARPRPCSRPTRQHGRLAARRPLLRDRFQAMRIAFDVSPLSHERTGVNNYIRGSLAGLAEVARPLGHEIVAFAPTSPAGKRMIPQALPGIDVETKLVTLPGAHGWRTAWSLAGHPAAERFIGTFDALHF